eukprot:GHVN01016209.1.p1 GENE.GHVN01016209.1~~GHVN01016209.1.p1  ORF type:complete len:805 (+),score=125.85 GHVN01016209.1:236-2416(+)
MSSSPLSYPFANRDDAVTEIIHGITVNDPYRWLEDPDSEDTKKFVEAQNDKFNNYINTDETNYFKTSLEKQLDYKKYGGVAKHGSKYYVWHNTGLQRQYVLYQLNHFDDELKESSIFLDPNTLSTDGSISIGETKASHSGDHLAYTTSSNGTDWRTVYFIDSKTKKVLSDVLTEVRLSCLVWDPTDTGIFYNRYPAGQQDNRSGLAENQMLYYHKIGTRQEDDILVLKFNNSKWVCGGALTDDKDYFIVSISYSCEPVNRIWWCPYSSIAAHLKESKGGIVDFTRLIDNFDFEYSFILNNGPHFYFRTNNNNCKKYKIVSIINNTKNALLDEVILIDESPPADSSVLVDATPIATNYLVVEYFGDVQSKLKVFNIDSGKQVDTIPVEFASVTSMSGKRDHTEMFFRLSSFTRPVENYRAPFIGDKQRLDSSQIKLLPNVSSLSEQRDQISVSQIKYKSKDGTDVPMFVVQNKADETLRSSQRPVLLYGYGGFNVSLTPWYWASALTFINSFNGIAVVANIRGGGEYGDTWHDGGKNLNKQNCFDDFIAAAEYLVKEKYTSPARLCIMGGSNGGLLTLAVAHQRPELFGAVVAQVPVTDMFRFHRFTVGYTWQQEFGDIEKEDEFMNMKKYSPLHTLPTGPLPALCIFTADHDDRVPPCHSLKYTAQMQHHITKDEVKGGPCLVRVDTKCGHGAGKSTDKVIEELANTFSFISTAIKAPPERGMEYE